VGRIFTSPRGFLVALFAALAGVLGAGPAEDCASEFLDAIIFQDAATAWAMLNGASQASQTPGELADALAALPIVADRAEIVRADLEGGQWRVRFRLHGVHRTSGEPMTWPGTLRVVGQDPTTLRIAYQPPAPPPSPVDQMVGSVGQAARQLLPGLPPSQVIDGVTAQDVLDRAVAAHGQIQSMRMGVSIRGTAMGQAIALDGDFLYSAPDRMRLDLGQILFFSDSGGATVHMVPANAHFRLPGPLVGGLTPGLGGFAPETQASLVGRESVAGFPTWHLVLASPSQGMGLSSLMGQMGMMHVWLDERTYLPRQARAGAMGVSLEIRFHSPAMNPEGIDPSVFTFRPPPGAMEIPMMLPGISGLGGG
jgi:hypothetical protein